MRVLKVYTRGMALGKKSRRLLDFCNEKELCVANTGFYKADKEKIIYSAGGCETKWCKDKRVGSAYSEEFKEKVGVHQGSVLSPLLLAIVVDVITENARRGVVMNYYMQMTLFS